MRNELMELYKIALESKAADDVRAYQRARDRIGPNIVVDEIMTVDELREEVARLKNEVERLKRYALTWTRYDGTPETLPEDSGAYLLLCLGGKVYTGSFDDGRFNDIACAMWSITCGPCIVCRRPIKEK